MYIHTITYIIRNHSTSLFCVDITIFQGSLLTNIIPQLIYSSFRMTITINNYSTIANSTLEYSHSTDVTLAVILIGCTLVGVTGNSFALQYFVFQKKDRPNVYPIYIAISVTDIIICITALPVAVTLINNRSNILFGNNTFCSVWGAVWLILETYSVFLVAILSISRTLTLLLKRSTKSNIAIIIISVYGLLLTVRSFLPIILGYEYFIYPKEDGYCWPTSNIGWFEKCISILIILQLAFPILPVILS